MEENSVEIQRLHVQKREGSLRVKIPEKEKDDGIWKIVEELDLDWRRNYFVNKAEGKEKKMHAQSDVCGL